MNKEQEQVLAYMEKDHRVNPTFLQCKMKITHNRAEELCHWAWSQRAKNAFYMRGWGLTKQEFERGDHLDG